MKSVKVYHYDAFSTKPDKGNPAGVVVDGELLSEAEMQEIASKVGFNETGFITKSDKADLRIRYFTPGHEMDLCGHGTIACLYGLHEHDLLPQKEYITIETKAGVLPIMLQIGDNGRLYITMKQPTPKFIEFGGSKADLASAIGLAEDDISDVLPVMYGSTGIWTLLLPIKSLAVFKRMKPQSQLFPKIFKEIPKASLHPFCLETELEHADMHARHFSSPFSGTVEDPVTGTAAGVMGAYYAEFIKKEVERPFELVIEQGLEIDRAGKVLVKVSDSERSLDIEIAGTAVYVKSMEIAVIS
ncbi:PhzF family phenazine biosynthesis protein [Bacillales bacterium AN1005]|uniref:PhzF family phenazine biosynthesis protein n=1 Tax=Niallia taxi TaxID=2499688 RepID=UPI0021A84869|nr:PhzF family phenazine biosynthesis isomerase [Niallia taxi]MCT2342938.1 PhzF family phenazine biosynthesis isomerase [Niallia taxi]